MNPIRDPAGAAAALDAFWRTDVPADPRLGTHDVVVASARLATSSSGHPMIVASLQDADDASPLPPLFLSLNPRGRDLLEQALLALGVPLPAGGSVSVSARTLVGRRVRIMVDFDVVAGRFRSRVDPSLTLR
jgi:hypothetical protein